MRRSAYYCRRGEHRGGQDIKTKLLRRPNASLTYPNDTYPKNVPTCIVRPASSSSDVLSADRLAQRKRQCAGTQRFNPNTQKSWSVSVSRAVVPANRPRNTSLTDAFARAAFESSQIRTLDVPPDPQRQQRRQDADEEHHTPAEAGQHDATTIAAAHTRSPTSSASRRAPCRSAGQPGFGHECGAAGPFASHARRAGIGRSRVARRFAPARTWP